MRKLWIFLFAFTLSFQFVNAQGTTMHQYRNIAPENMQEYLKRETTYWKKFAEQEVKKGNLTFWAILQKVGGVDLLNTPNILIVNTFNNIDKQLNWGAVNDLFPDVKMEDIDTQGLGATTATIFLRSLDNHVQGEDVDPVNDFKYVKVIYHNPKNTGLLLNFESEKWKPMIQKAMNDGTTTMKGWGNARIIHPSSESFPYTTSSHDIFASLEDALRPMFKQPLPFSDGFFDDISENEKGARKITLYRLVSFVSANDE